MTGRGSRALARWLGLAGFEPSDRLGGGASDFEELVVAVVDPPGGAGVLDGEGAPGVVNADVDALPGDDEAAAAAYPPLVPDRVGGGCRWWAGGPGTADAGQLGRGEGVGQAAQRAPVGVEDVQHAVVDAGGDPLAGEVVADAD